MIKIKSFDVGDGDMFYIKHGSDNFTVIDCNLIDERKEEIMNEIIAESKSKGIRRFISTHPDEDHIHGLELFNYSQPILNFYCVENHVTKKYPTNSFDFYQQIRDDSNAVFYIYKDCRRRWMNCNTENRGSACINILWPNLESNEFQAALIDANETGEPNNISPIIQYQPNNSIRILWFGDLEHDFMKSIQYSITMPRANIVFAPHHGRDSGTIPKKWLTEINPQIIIIGTAPSEYINYYYGGYKTITQNTAGDITLYCENNKIHFYSSNKNYDLCNFLTHDTLSCFFKHLKNEYYIGTLITGGN